MNKVQKAWGNTAGYKRGTGAVLLALYTFIKAVAPNLLQGAADEVTRATIDLLIITGGLDWVWRNRDKIIEFLIKKFKKNGKRKESS
jgi:hypothetical protein